MKMYQKRCLLVLLLLVLPLVSAADHDYTITELPYTNSITIQFTGTVNETYSVDYGPFVSGDSEFTIQSNPHSLNTSISIQSASLGTYHSHVYISGNDTNQNTSFEFSIQDPVTTNNFSITVQESGVFDDYYEMTYYGPDDTIVYVNTSRVDQPCNVYPTSFCNAQLEIDSDGDASFIFSPEENGDYVTHAIFLYGGESYVIEKNFTVDSFNELVFNFSYAPEVIFPGDSVDFTTEVASFEGDIDFEWDFDNDGDIDATTANVTKIFQEAGEYEVNLTVKDDINEESQMVSITVDGQTYNVTIKVKAGNTLLESAEVTLDNKLKYTNLNGTAIFEVTGGNKSLNVEKDPYNDFDHTLVVSESFTYTVDLLSGENSTVVQNTTDTSSDEPEVLQSNADKLKSKHILLITPENDTQLSPESVIFSYKVNHDAVDLCQLYLKHEDKQYILKNTNSVVPFDTLMEFELNDMRGGNYQWRVKCTTDEDETFSEVRSFSIFNENAQAIGDELDQTDAMLTEINSILVAIRKAKDEKLTSAIQLLGLEEKLFEQKESLESLKKTISGFEVSEDPSYLEKEIAYAQQKRESVKKDTVRNVSLVDSADFIFLPSQADVEKAIPEYLSSLSNTEDYDLGEYEERNSELQKKVTVNTAAYVLELIYLSGEKEYLTVVDKTVQFEGDLGEHVFVEIIPKELAEDYEQLHMFTDNFEVLNYDPVLSFDLSQTNRVQYAIKKNLFTSEIERTSSVVLDPHFEMVSKILGLTIPAFIGLVGGLVLLVVLGVLAVKFGNLNTHFAKLTSKLGPLQARFKKAAPAKKASKKKHPRLEKVIDHVVELARKGKEKEAATLYAYVEKKYALQSDLRKLELDYKITWMKHELTKIHLENLVKTAYEHIKNEIVHDAKKVYDEIVAHYPHLPTHHQIHLKDVLLQLQAQIKALHFKLNAPNGALGGVSSA